MIVVNKQATIIVSAIVVDENGKPLEGVNVFEVGQTESTYTGQTNATGKFNLQASSSSSDLRFTRLGYKTTYQSISTTNESRKVIMTEAPLELEEVQVPPKGQKDKTETSNLWLYGLVAVVIVVAVVASQSKSVDVEA